MTEAQSEPSTLLTTFVVPTTLARSLAEFVQSHGFVVADAPPDLTVNTGKVHIVLPHAEVVSLHAALSERFEVVYPGPHNFGIRPTVIEHRGVTS